MRVWKNTRHSFSGPKDSRFTPDIYFNCGKDVLTGKREVMGWSVSGPPHILSQSVAEQLHGSSMYSRRYAAVKSALAGSDTVTDDPAK